VYLYSLADALNLGVIAAYQKHATGQKFLINPNLLDKPT
jgi:hypothetical protein